MIRITIISYIQKTVTLNFKYLSQIFAISLLLLTFDIHYFTIFPFTTVNCPQTKGQIVSIEKQFVFCRRTNCPLKKNEFSPKKNELSPKDGQIVL